MLPFPPVLLVVPPLVPMLVLVLVLALTTVTVAIAVTDAPFPVQLTE